MVDTIDLLWIESQWCENSARRLTRHCRNRDAECGK